MKVLALIAGATVGGLIAGLCLLAAILGWLDGHA